MSDYKRLVSYIYSYPGGMRDKNVGFAKAEVRGGQFKLSVSLKGVYTDAPETFGIYLMVDRDTEVEGRFTLLQIGNVIVNSGMGQYTDLLNPENMNDSGYTFSEISGVAVARTDDRFYMMFSLWEDCIVKPESIYFAPENYKKAFPEKADEPTEQIKKEQTEVPAEESLEPQKEAEAAALKEEKSEEQMLVQEEEPLTEEIELPVQPADTLMRVAVEPVEDEAEDAWHETVQAKDSAEGLPEFVLRGMERSTSMPEDSVQATSMAQQMERQVSDRPGFSKNPQARRPSMMQNRQQAQGWQQQRNRQMQNPSAFHSPIQPSVRPVKEEANRLRGQEDGFSKLFRNADFIDAFDDDYYYDCVEVSPEVLKTLPIEDEAIINNSFLVHGYYNFKHILFGRVQENDNNTRYFIGVPGMYCNRERFMASMFGFNNFKKSHRSDYANPYFGYWYQEI